MIKNWPRYRLVFMMGMIIIMLFVNVFSGRIVVNVRAEESGISLSVADTGRYVEKVEQLASDLYNNNNFATQTGGGAAPNSGKYAAYAPTGYFSWDSESTSVGGSPKNRSWTYYNGIMMDAFLMLDSASYIQKVNDFYDININSSGNVDNKNPDDSNKNKNKYATEELDSIPPTRALFDLIKSGNRGDGNKYVYMIDYVYNVMENYKTAYLSNSEYGVLGFFENCGGNFRHKIVKRNSGNSWLTWPIALDGLYMANPFYMEIANALDAGILTQNDFIQYTGINNAPTSGTLYNEVCNRLLWIGNNLYDSSSGLYHHGYNPATGKGNGHFWSRAIGWYAAALADVISMLPAGYESQRTALINYEKQLFDGMLAYQDVDTGMWYNVVNKTSDDYSANLLESSGTALMAYSSEFWTIFYVLFLAR